MAGKPHKLLLTLMMLALVITPLRGLWAFSVADVSETKPHCAQMDMPASGQHAQVTDDAGHPCKMGCNGDCCDDSCNTCAHSPVSLLNSVALPPGSHGMSLAVPVATSFPHRTVIPPLRPPALL